MRAPAHWDRDGLLARALSPLGRLYAAATSRRVRREGLRLPVPVISVGNLTAGGTGKTPVVVDLLQRLGGMGLRAHVVTRGHGGRLPGPVRVDPRHHGADEVGDEPLLLAARGPVWVARDRAAGGRAAVEAGAQALILDDAHQNPALRKDLSLVVVDAETGFGNGFCIPAGPLREPVATGLSRADLAVVLGPPAMRRTRLAALGRLPVVEGELVPHGDGPDWAGMRVLAFAGIGRPEKFFATLRALGAEVVRAVPLADHRPLGEGLMRGLAAEADALGVRLVCTEKDAVRLSPHRRTGVLTLPVRIEWADDRPLRAALESVLERG